MALYREDFGVMDGKETLGFSSINLRNLYIQCFVLAQFGPWRVKGKSVIAGVAHINHTDLLSLGISL